MTTYAIGSPFTAAFFSGTSAASSDVPRRWPCALNGRTYMIDDQQVREHLEQTIPALRQQFGSSDEPGDRTLNPEGAWRRSSSSWHHGAGQPYFDDASSDSHRFRSSKGIDVWTRGRLTLLVDTAQAHAPVNSIPHALMVSSQGYIYYADGNTVYRTDGTTSTACTGTPASACSGLSTLGAAVYAAFGANGTYKITGTVGSAFVGATAASGIGVAKQRVLAWNTNTLYDESAASATTVYARTVDTSFAWVAVADGTSFIYAAGNSSTTGVIYRIAVTNDAAALAAPIVAGRLPDGEQVVSLFGYAGLVFIGTTSGYRVAREASTGDLAVGPLVDLGKSVYAWAARGQYVWFGWSNYDATSTGVGRIDPTVLNDNGTYAYASDLMVTGQGTVEGIAFIGSTMYLGVDALGVYKPTTAPIASGTIELGIVSFDIAEQKLLIGGSFSNIGAGTVTMSVSIDDDTYQPIDESGFNQSGNYFEPRLTLTAVGGVAPSVRSTVLRAFPQQQNTRVLVVPLLIANPVHLPETGAEARFDITAGMSEIRDLWSTRTVATYQEGNDSWAVTVEDYEFRKTDPSDSFDWQGTCVVKMKVVQ